MIGDAQANGLDGETYRADLVVVGAGPAGMGTAYYAARLGLDVILLEKEQFPRDRICGDGLLAQTVSEMERLGLGDWLLEKHHGRINGLAVRTKTASFAEALPPDPRGSRGFVVRRREFEPKILERVRASGALFRDGVEVTRLLRSPAGAMLGAEARELESGDSLRFEAPLVAVAAGFGGWTASWKGATGASRPCSSPGSTSPTPRPRRTQRAFS